MGEKRAVDEMLEGDEPKRAKSKCCCGVSDMIVRVRMLIPIGRTVQMRQHGAFSLIRQDVSQIQCPQIPKGQGRRHQGENQHNEDRVQSVPGRA